MVTVEFSWCILELSSLVLILKTNSIRPGLVFKAWPNYIAIEKFFNLGKLTREFTLPLKVRESINSMLS